MQVLYVRAPGPGAIIRLVERYEGNGTWCVSVTPADLRTGFRCVVPSECDVTSLAEHLTTCLRDSVYLIDQTTEHLRIVKLGHTDDSAVIDRESVVDIRLHPFFLIRQQRIRKALTNAGLPHWISKLHRLRHVSYETVAVLDQRDLLVEAPDVVYTAQGTIVE